MKVSRTGLTGGMGRRTVRQRALYLPSGNVPHGNAPCTYPTALHVVTGHLTTRLLEQPARSKAKTGQSKQQRLHVAFAAHLRDIARAYPARQSPAVVITIAKAPWHRGALLAQV